MKEYKDFIIDGTVMKEYTGKEKEIVIPNGITVIGTGLNKAFRYSKEITSVVIPDSVKAIADHAFLNCTKLAEIEFPESVSCIGYDSFKNCTSLKSINIGANIENIDYGAFSGCSSLNTITVSEDNKIFDSRGNCNAVVKTKTNNLVTGCKSTVIPESVNRIGGYAFQGCTKLKTIKLPDSIKHIGIRSFADCPALTDINIPESVKNIGNNVFENCKSLKAITIPESVEKISNCAFLGCGLSLIRYNSKSENILDWSQFTEKASDFNIKIFAPYLTPKKFSSVIMEDCALLGFVDNYNSEDIPDNIKESYIDSLTKRYKKFYPYLNQNSNLLNFYIDNKIIPLKDIDKLVETIDNVETQAALLNYKETAFSAKEKDKLIQKNEHREESELELALGMREMNLSDWRAVYKISFKDGFICIGGYKGTDTDITIPSKIEKYSVKFIGKNAFSKSKIKSVVLPDTIEEIGDCAFKDCMSLKEIVIPDSVLVIGNNAFSGCGHLSSFEFPGKIKKIGEEAFYNCSNLTSITIPDDVKSIGFNAFMNCYSLKKANYTGTSGQWAQIEFDNNDSNPISYSKNLYINDSLVTDCIIEDGVTSISDYAFYNCENLTNITIPDSVISIGYSAFSGCKGLKKVNYTGTLGQWAQIEFNVHLGWIPNSNPIYYSNNLYIKDVLVTDGVIEQGVTSISDYAFYNCQSLNNISIPDSISEIGSNTFYRCTGLTDINIPESVIKIKYDSFAGCPEIKINCKKQSCAHDYALKHNIRFKLV